MTPDEAITVLLLTSPLPSHPSTAILDETLASVRHWLPTADVLLLCDGVRPEQEDRREAYTEAVRRHLHDCALNWERVTPVLAREHVHQSGLLRLALPLVRTPLVLWCEGDTPLTPDCEVPFAAMAEAIGSGEFNLIRLLHEAFVHPEHELLMVDPEPVNVAGIPVRRTMQFSARPFLCSTAWLRALLDSHFAPDARCFVEDRAYGIIEQAWREHGRFAWNIWRLGILEPEGNAKRSYHLDGRDGGEKFVESQTW